MDQSLFSTTPWEKCGKGKNKTIFPAGSCQMLHAPATTVMLGLVWFFDFFSCLFSWGFGCCCCCFQIVYLFVFVSFGMVLYFWFWYEFVDLGFFQMLRYSVKDRKKEAVLIYFAWTHDHVGLLFMKQFLWLPVINILKQCSF